MTLETKRSLLLQSVKMDIPFKRHCENILEAASNISENKLPVQALKAKKKNEEAVVLNDDLDKSGKFVRVEKSIYTNHKCYKVSKLVIGKGVEDTYHANIMLAKEFLGK